MSWPNLLPAVLLLAWLSAHAGVQPAETAPGKIIYVSTVGNDAWSGALPEPKADGSDGPLATLDRARDAIRALKQAGPLPEGGVAVHVRAGAYELPGSFKLAAQDAGTEAAPIVYRAQPGETVVLTGAREITGFVPHQGQILKADLAAQGLKGKQFRQLSLDGRRQHLARYPNFDPQNPHGGGYAYVEGEPLSMYKDLPEEELRVIRLKPGDIRTWAHPEGGEVIIFPRYNWINMAVPIQSADPAAGTITLGKDIAWGNFKGIRPMDRFYVRNLPEELDSPGEWYLDKATDTVYFWPPASLEGSVVRAPMTESVVEIGPGANWISLRGFTIEGCDSSAVVLRGSDNCLVAGNTIHDTGGSLGYSAGVLVEGGRNCGVVGNDMYEICNYAIRLNSSGADQNGYTSTGHYAENNYIHHIGVLNGHGCGIYLSGIGLRASHNLIHDITRCGIFGGGTDCVVEYNHIRHVNLETEDTGGFYSGAGWHVRGLVIRYNLVHDVLGYGRTGDRWTSPHFAWGIYLDDDLSGVHVYGNIVARTTLGGSHIHAGRDNVLENNVFIEGANQQMQYSGHDPKSWVVDMHMEAFRKALANPAWCAKYPELAKADLDTLYLMAGNKFRRNIIYYKNPQAKLYRYSRNDAPETNESDYNLIWHFGLPLDVALPGVPVEKQWEQWRAQGNDIHSVVADPLFVDADRDDYRLQPESPAFALGFEAIPVDEIGLYESPLRASWPVVEAPGVRETPLVETRVEMPAKPSRVAPLVTAPGLQRTPVIDGALGEGEWPAAPILMSQGTDGEPLKTAPCRMNLGHDGESLYVAVTVPVKDVSALQLGETWERHDAAEVCFQAVEPGPAGPVFVVHGFATGKHESVSEAGAPADAARRLGEAVAFAAGISGGEWTAEWRIPLAAAGIAARPGLKLAFNVGVRRTEAPEWIQWCGSGATWTLAKAGFVVVGAQ